MKIQNAYTMEQPELGKKIFELRKSQGLTQEELVEKCNLNVRTIQRIETGEVTPRTYTIKAILNALGYDLSAVKGYNISSASRKFLKLAWILGIAYFIIGFFELAAEFYRFERDEMIFSDFLYIGIKLLVLITYVFFMYGFVLVGRLFVNPILKITSILLLSLFALSIFFDILSLYYELLPFEILLGIESVSFGCLQLIFGIALLKLTKELGNVALVAGILEIITGALFITVILALAGLVTYTPAILFEIMILYKASEKVKV